MALGRFQDLSKSSVAPYLYRYVNTGIPWSAFASGPWNRCISLKDLHLLQHIEDRGARQVVTYHLSFIEDASPSSTGCLSQIGLVSCRNHRPGISALPENPLAQEQRGFWPWREKKKCSWQIVLRALVYPCSSATVPSRNQILTHDANNSPDGVTLAPAPPISEDDVNSDSLVDISVGERYHSVLLPEADAYSLGSEYAPGSLAMLVAGRISMIVK
ncbi:hypothetical protein V8C42DRAFT_194093 [Trichoderma barbatum]